MIDWIHDYYAYCLIVLLMVIGLYGMLMKQNLLKKLMGMIIFQNSIILFFVTFAFKYGGTVPVLDANLPTSDTSNYLNPLPQTLMLTAIVVGVAIVGVAFAMLIMIYKNFQTLEEPEILEQMK